MGVWVTTRIERRALANGPWSAQRMQLDALGRTYALPRNIPFQYISGRPYALRAYML
jgi:hypothetical protein